MNHPLTQDLLIVYLNDLQIKKFKILKKLSTHKFNIVTSCIVQ
ncbi:MAG: hypothetical protein BAJALOKI1v1_1100007 [Promethearchaeota archaeon]|nr:MAG: hypothetical protein BAJALOKI1v1_1100007 [Candidatus Lokiarchaeota archaeon]